MGESKGSLDRFPWSPGKEGTVESPAAALDGEVP